MTKITLHLSGLAACMALTTIAHANLVVNGGFENMPNWGSGIAGDGGYTLFSGAAIPGWTIEANRGATIHNTVLYPTISGGYSLNTDGEGWNGHNVDMYQDFAAASGVGYKLTFDWKNWQTSTAPKLDVSIIDVVTSNVLTQGNYGIMAGLNSETLLFTGTGNAVRLRVKCAPESGFNDNTFIVDNFAVEAVPEPASFMALGLGLLVFTRRRK